MKSNLFERIKHEKNKVFIKKVTYFLLAIIPLMLFFSLETTIIYTGFVLLGLFVLAHSFDTSLPAIGKYLEKKYFNNSWKLNINQVKRNKSLIGKFKYLFYFYQGKILFNLIILCKSSKGSFRILREELYAFYYAKIEKTHSKEHKLARAKDIIGRLKKQEQVSLSQIEELEDILYDFFKNIRKRVTYFSLSGATIMVLAISVTSIIFTNVSDIKAATYGWVQTDWSGGANTSDIALHTTDQTGWNKYYSKDANLSAGTELTLSAGSSQIEHTTTADFSAGSTTNGMIDIIFTDDEIKMDTWYDATSMCGNFSVFKEADSIYYTKFEALVHCLGMCENCRLPTEEELVCMCNNQASFGDNFSTVYHWTSEDLTVVAFSDCGTATRSSGGALVRCIEDNN